MDRKDLQELSKVRLKEARALLRAGSGDGAYYLAGYAVECALKACIAKGTSRHEFPDRKKVEASHSHNLRDLVRVAGLEERMSGDQPRIRISHPTGKSRRHGLSRVATERIE